MTEVRLFVVPRDRYNELELATVADIRKCNRWKSMGSYMRPWTNARLADGRCGGSEFVRGIQQTPNTNLSHKVVIRRLQKIGKTPFLGLAGLFYKICSPGVKANVRNWRTFEFFQLLAQLFFIHVEILIFKNY